MLEIMPRKRLAIVATHPIQYQAPIWRALAQMPDLKIHVYYGSDLSVRGYIDPEFKVDVKWDVPLLAGYDYTILSANDMEFPRSSLSGLHAYGLRRHLREFDPEAALITAYLPIFWLEAIGILRSMRTPIVLRAEATDVAVKRSYLKHAVRDLLLRLLYGQICQYLAIGRNAQQHYLAHGIPASRIGWSPYCVDSSLFDQQYTSYSLQRVSIRHELAFDDNQFVLIYSGKLSPKKNPLIIEQALKLMTRQQQEHMGLIVVGDGELRQAFETACHKLLPQRTIFTGFVNQSEIGKYYAAADCLILPSAWGETWGLVVNEALQFGLPVIVSDRVGCHPDLVVEDETGYVFPAGDAQGLCTYILKAMNLIKADRATLSRRCRSQVAAYSVQAAANGIHSAVLSL
jgi:glycosyltransferase involved in cell wall biosynthesis